MNKYELKKTMYVAKNKQTKNKNQCIYQCCNVLGHLCVPVSNVYSSFMRYWNVSVSSRFDHELTHCLTSIVMRAMKFV